MSVTIHPSSFVDPKAELGDGVDIGPLCVVGPDVKLGKNVKLVAQVNLAGNTAIGENSELYPFVSMGHPPQDFKHKGGPMIAISWLAPISLMRGRWEIMLLFLTARR